MTKKKIFSYLNSTLKFAIAGFILPSLGAIIFLGLQVGLTFLGIECSQAIKILWTLTSIGLITTPFVFVRLMTKRLMTGYCWTDTEITIFNALEYVFIQSSLVALFTTSKTLCYVSDGQNGWEFVFTGWIAIPILITFSVIFDSIQKSKIEEIKADRIANKSSVE